MAKVDLEYVTHDQVEAMPLADRIAIMNQGRIVQVGTPFEVYNYPADKFVAGFIGAPRMNFIPARLIETDSGLSVELNPQIYLTVPNSRVKALRSHLERNLELGLRPEHLVVGEGSEVAEPARFQANVEIVEPMGGRP